MATLKDILRGRTKSEWRRETLKERLSYLENDLYVLHPDNVKVLNEVKRLIRRTENTGKGRALLIICDSGGGKSHFVKLLQRMMPVQETTTGSLVPIVSFSVPGNPTPDQLTKSLLHGVGDPAWNSKVPDISRAMDLIQYVHTRVIAVDNVQDIPEHRGTIGTRRASNWIRDLIDNSSKVIVLLGTRAAEEIVQSNPQLRRRVPTKLMIPYFGITPDESLKRLRRFLREVDAALPLAELSELEKHAKQIYWATYGIADYIFKLLAESVETAVEAGRERLIGADLERAFDLIFQDAGLQLNPFSLGGPERLLDGEGEPFEKWNENAGVSRSSRRRKTDVAASA